MNILITGSNGFIGKNLINLLSSRDSIENIFEFEKNNNLDDLAYFCKKADVVFHLAAVLRPETDKDYDKNIDLTSTLLRLLSDSNNKCPIMFSSSIQAELNNSYGECKRVEEKTIIEYGISNNVSTYVFRFPNLFGTMSRPNYTSVISTFCYNTVKGLPLVVNNPAAQIRFSFIEEVLNQVITTVLLKNPEKANTIITIEDYYTVGLGELAYYMETLKRDVVPSIKRGDCFYKYLKLVYDWYVENSYRYDCD